MNKAGKKRKRDDGQDPLSKRADKENRIDMVFQQLKELHGEQFSGPQLRLWARMNVNNQHESLDSPPRIPIFSGVTPTKTVKSNSLNEALTSAATAVVSSSRLLLNLHSKAARQCHQQSGHMCPVLTWNISTS